MNGMAKTVVAFAMGVAAGAAASALYFKSKYEQEVAAEVESFKDMYERRIAKLETKKNVIAQVKPTINGALDDVTLDESRVRSIMTPNSEDLAEREEYEREAAMYGSLVDIPDLDSNAYTIPAEAFDELPDYQCFELTYYADGVVADDRDIALDDANKIIGDAVDHFGEYDDPDVVYVRNDALRCDYEIYKSELRYADVKGEEDE